MEGELYKWNGYLTGWTTKYFVLYNGSICYYPNKTARDNHKPASETLNMGLCEIVLDTNSTTQWELRTPAQSKIWYLRTISTPERNQWIKALGSAKACLLDTTSLNSFSRSTSLESSSQLISSKLAQTEERVQDQSSINDVSDCDNLKEESDEINDSGNGSMNNLLVNVDSSSFMMDQTVDYPNHLNDSLAKQCDNALRHIKQLHSCLTLPEAPRDIKDVINEVEVSVEILTGRLAEFKLAIMTASQSSTEGRRVLDDFPSSVDNTSEIVEPDVKKQEENFPTFFSSCETHFGDVLSASVIEEGQSQIPLRIFLDACQSYMDYFERLASSYMTPLKTDIQGNIDKIRKVAAANPSYKTLQDILKHEISTKQHTGPDTGTQALLWLNRGLRVMSNYLLNLFLEDSETKHDPAGSLVSAYSKLLSMHHNWMVQRLFKMGLKMVPNYESFKESMANKDALKELKASKEHWESYLDEEIKKQGILYSNDMWSVAEHVCALYESYDIKV